MPFASDEVLEKLEENIKNLEPVTKMLETRDDPEYLLECLLKGFDIDYTDELPIKFYCNCDKDRVKKALISVGKKELKAMIDEGKPISVNCHFCNTDYEFTLDELKAMAREL